jgi:hypothetical protein
MSKNKKGKKQDSDSDSDGGPNQKGQSNLDESSDSSQDLPKGK